MNSKPKDYKKNWFQQNPKKSLAAVILFLILVLTVATEKFLGWQNRRNGIFLEAEPRYIRLKEYRPGTQLMLGFPKEHLKYTDNVFRKRYPLRIDAEGFIMPSQKHQHPDAMIVFLGGSTTECMYMDEEKRFPYVVGTILEQKTGKKINSYNAGMSGNNSLHSIDILVNKVIPLKPQVVVFMENINDLSVLVYEGTYWNRNTSRSPIETLARVKLVGKFLKEILIPNLNYAYRSLKKTLSQKEGDEFAGARGKKLQLDKERLIKEYEMNLQAIVSLCRAWGTNPVLMTQANRVTANPDPVVSAYLGRYGSETGLSYAEFKDLYDSFNEAIRRVGQRNEVIVIDLASEVPQDKKYLYDMVHFNDFGSQYAAGIIAARLEPLIKNKMQGR